MREEMLQRRMMAGSCFQPRQGQRQVEHVESAPLVSPPPARPGFFVDFTGHEDLLTQFEGACTTNGFTPSESALDIIYLFCTSQLAKIVKKGAAQ